MRRPTTLLLATLLLASSAQADPAPAGRDPLTARGQVLSVAGSQLALTAAQGFDADPFQSQPLQSIAWPTAAFGGATPRPLFYPAFVPQLTLRLPSVWGLQPLVTSRPWGLTGGAPRLNSDFGLLWAVGRFHTGVQLQVLRDMRGIALSSVSFARYVAPTFHVGLQDSAIWPLTTAQSSTHAVSVSAGVRRTPSAPALRVSTTLRQRARGPSVASLLFTAF